MRTLFDGSMIALSGGPFLGFNFPRLLQDIQPFYQATRNLVKDQQGNPITTTTPTAQPPIARPLAPVDNSMTYLVLGALALGGAGAAWYYFRKKKKAGK